MTIFIPVENTQHSEKPGQNPASYFAQNGISQYGQIKKIFSSSQSCLRSLNPGDKTHQWI
jgi:hypothetical protein